MPARAFRTLGQPPRVEEEVAVLLDESWRRRTVTTVDGVRLPVVESGDEGAAPVVLVHGVASSWTVWQDLMLDPTLCRDWRLIAFDLRGHGQARAPLTAEQLGSGDLARIHRCWAADVQAVLADLPGAYLVGWSFGSTAVQDWLVDQGGLAGRAGATFINGPDLLGPVPHGHPAAGLIGPEAFTALAGAASGGERAFAERVVSRGGDDETGEDETRSEGGVTARLVEEVAAAAAQADPAAAQAALSPFDHEAFLLGLPGGRLSRLHAIVCQQDQVFDSEALRGCWSTVGVDVDVVPGEGHALPLRDPARLATLLTQHLRRSQD